MPALDEVTLDVGRGELLTVVGPSGSGKSTLLRCIAGLEPADRGRVEVNGRDITRLAPAARGLALVFQGYALFPHLDVAENIGFGLRARGGRKEPVRTAVEAVAERLELGGLLTRRPAQLSGGERQRVALARGLVGEPAVLLLDEPLSSLDAQLRARAREEVRAVHAATGTTMVLVTHDQHEALTLGDRVALLRAGRLEQVGTPAEVYDAPASAWAAGFLGEPPMNVVPGAALGLPHEPLVGVRPEGLIPRDATGMSDGIDAVVSSVERAGHDVVWRVRTTNGTALAVRPGAGVATPTVGASVELAVAPGALRRFDAETGRAR